MLSCYYNTPLSLPIQRKDFGFNNSSCDVKIYISLASYCFLSLDSTRFASHRLLISILSSVPSGYPHCNGFYSPLLHVAASTLNVRHYIQKTVDCSRNLYTRNFTKTTIYFSLFQSSYSFSSACLSKTPKNAFALLTVQVSSKRLK